MNGAMRVFATLLIALSAYALAVHAAWTGGLALPGLVRPAILALSVASVAIFLHRAGGDLREDAAGDRTIALVCCGLVLVAIAPIVYALLTSGPREWDGFATWELRARHLAGDAGVFAPFFTDLGVYSPARGYPMLPPLVLADAIRVVGMPAARLVYVLLFVGLLFGVYGYVRRRLPARRALAGVLAVGLMPFWIGTGAGNVDSGYAELAIGFALVGACFGLGRDATRATDSVGRDEKAIDLVFAAALAALPMLKPEGVIYALLALAAGMGSVRHRRVVLGSLGLALGASAAAWMRARLLGGRESLALAYAALPGLLLLLHLGMGRIRVVRVRRLAAFAAIAGCGLAAAWFSLRLGGPLGALLAETSAAGGSGWERVAARFAQTPALFAGLAESLFSVRKFALLWPLVVLALFLRRPAADAALLRFLALGLAASIAALLLVPEADLGHEFRSRFDRLLLHWSVPAWLFVLPHVLASDPSSPGMATSEAPAPAERSQSRNTPGRIDT